MVETGAGDLSCRAMIEPNLNTSDLQLSLAETHSYHIQMDHTGDTTARTGFSHLLQMRCEAPHTSYRGKAEAYSEQ